jgi:hypothetical protein
LFVYKQDNKAFWLKLAAMTRGKPCWTFVSQYQKSQDARKAYWALYDHYLGPSNVDLMAARAEGKLQTTTYHGEQKRWNFERYVALHVDQHTILKGLMAYGHSGIDPRSKVRHLIAGIRTTTLDSVKNAVMTSPLLRVDFDATARHYKDFIDQMKSTQSEVNVATLTTGGGDDSTPYESKGGGADHGFDGVKADMLIQDRYYNVGEYRKLTPAQKYGLHLKRNSREDGGGRGGGCGGGRGGGRGRGRGGGRGADRGRATVRNPQWKSQSQQSSKRTVNSAIKAIAKKVAFALHKDDEEEPRMDESSEDDRNETAPKKQKSRLTG